MPPVLTADIGDSLQRASDAIFEWIPRLIGAAVILLVAWLIARAVAALLERALGRAGIDRAAHSGGVGARIATAAPGLRPSRLIAQIAFWLILLTGVLIALSALGIPAVDTFVADAIAYLPNVVAAILIVAVAVALSGVVTAAARRFMGDTAIGRIIAVAAPALILTIAGFMALVQLRIAVPIVTGAFYIVLGAIALGAAIAFGLGGQGAARRLIDDAYEAGRRNMPQAAAEARLARERAQSAASGGTGQEPAPPM
ncbi:MAG TPA: hypothetical protein VNT51_10855 [Miltoncostaeaceae bacterium]|nr:hypothetical protein [Miltoncostaeaceae bacterium]